MADVSSPGVVYADIPVGKYAQINGGGPLAGQFLVKGILGVTSLNHPEVDITDELGAYTYTIESKVDITNA